MADTIAYVVGGSISHAEIREVEPTPPVAAPKIPPAPVAPTDFKTIKPEPDLTRIIPVELTRTSTSFWSDSP